MSRITAAHIDIEQLSTIIRWRPHQALRCLAQFPPEVSAP
jgi:hypothetical protein